MEKQTKYNQENKKQEKKIHFEKSNPNKEYSLLHIASGNGQNMIEMDEELITDGDIASMTHQYKEDDNNYSTGSIIIDIKNASYTIIQRITNKKIDYAQVFTNIREESKIDIITNIASIKNMNKGELLTTKHPYIRKIKL